MDRRELLRLAAAGSLLTPAAVCRAGTAVLKATAGADWKGPILKYLESLARPDGGFGWEDQPDSHLTPTWAAIGSYAALGVAPPNKETRARFVRTHHPITGEGAEAGKHAAELRTFVWQQIQSLLWLGEDAASFAPEVKTWTKPSAYPLTYEPRGYPIFQQELMAFLCRALLGLPMNDLAPELLEYVDSRRRANGSFNNTPAADGSDGNVLNTLWGILALRALGRGDDKKNETAAWLRDCQLASGGFTHQPRAAIGGTDDAYYTRAAVWALQQLAAEPADREGCLRYLRSLWNPDGGFGDRPGLPSRPEATYYALDALARLGETPGPQRRAAPVVKTLPAGLRPFTIQLEAQGSGSPVEAVELARALRIDLWGCKNSTPEWIARAQAIADERKVAVQFFVSNEEYGTFMSLPGLGTYSHLSDIVAPAKTDFGLSLANQPAEPWPEFRRKRIAPLEKAGGRMIWQICDNEEFERVQLDDSVVHGGYAAISSFHFQQNFVYMLPWLWRYRHEIPFVALQDAHGNESWWWADELAGYRTVFLAAAPTWEGWLKALREQWVVAIRHDAVTKFRTRLLGGGPGVQDFVRRREAAWKWWGEDPAAIRRPLASVVVVKPEDSFEEGRPAEGATIRVRCWWEGRVARVKPVVELVRLEVDGKAVTTELIEKRGGAAGAKAGKKGAKKAAKKAESGGALLDCYHIFPLPASLRGKHTATATVRLLATGRESQESVSFTL